jgi:hypothetical protein
VCSGRADEGEGGCAGKGAGTKAEGAEAGGAGAEEEERGASKVIKTGIEEGNRERGVSIRIDL